MMACFNLDFAWDSAMALRTIRAACTHSASVVLSTSGPINERGEGNSPNKSVESTTPPGRSV